MDLPVNIAHSGDHHPPPVIDGSPWKHYKTAYGLEMGGYVAVVCKIPATDRLFSMHSISGPSRAQKVDVLRSLNHENILLPEEIFTYEDSSCAITEAAAISLGDLVLVRPDETQLAAIVGQVLRGVCYLASRGLSHGSISHANVLLTTKGIVKIAGCEGCSSASGETRKADARALGRVMCWLMGDETEIAPGGDEPEKSPLRLKDPKKWSAEAVDFLSLTLSVSVQTLAEINELIPNGKRYQLQVGVSYRQIVEYLQMLIVIGTSVCHQALVADVPGRLKPCEVDRCDPKSSPNAEDSPLGPEDLFIQFLSDKDFEINIRR
ncbi:Serine/threonine-protein kinase dst2 [Diaporthe amygdali]|uniref:Serine/threonine-protein kinase dst2 n=1 Tax=Phomopsis amygdali TaxID=1214568 RepID=UPI0022FF1A5E|nr:Serine/threonine-protein kinase dst2 [Diaporthe amygdali]KAJ0103783.1 Serine/threonine-protein kinase dst2 [Diaporthe amygdali]